MITMLDLCPLAPFSFLPLILTLKACTACVPVKVFIPSNVGKSAFTFTKEALCTTGVRAVGEGRYKRDRKVSKR